MAARCEGTTPRGLVMYNDANAQRYELGAHRWQPATMRDVPEVNRDNERSGAGTVQAWWARKTIRSRRPYGYHRACVRRSGLICF